MVNDSENKREYYPPELEFILYNSEDTLTGSGGASTDHNDNGNGSGLSGNDYDSDINYDLFDMDSFIDLT